MGSTSGPFPNDNRITLDERINGRQGVGGFLGVRQAYQPDPNSTNAPPQIVLVAHSLGALLSHYYMLKNAANHGVRRLVTIAGAHQGSMLANWITWYKSNGGRLASSFDNHNVDWVVKLLMRPIAPSKDPLPGFFRYWDWGAIQNAMMIRVPGVFIAPNDLLPFFWNTPAPKIEYVFNAYQMPADGSDYSLLRMMVDDANIDPVFLRGDGFVPFRSAFGKDGSTSPSIWNGRTSINPNIHDIDPVLFGVWGNTDHTAATSHGQSLFQSLFGVPYQWRTILGAPTYEFVAPLWARTYDESQSFGKYLSLLDSGGAHSDEPGIGELILLSQGVQSNAFIIPSLNTWIVTNIVGSSDQYPQNLRTNKSDLAGCQIIGDSNLILSSRTLVGTKNSSREPFGVSGTNYWAIDGNEYLPASLYVGRSVSSSPDLGSAGFFPFTPGLVSQCLVFIGTNDTPEHQYGLSALTWDGIKLTASSSPTYCFAQGTNLAGLYTPFIERGFDVPVDSATVVNLLCGINEREAAAGAEQTKWTTWVTEWLDLSPTNTTIMLNFFPTHDPNTWGFWLEDAFTETLYEDWTTYDTGSKTFSIPPPDAQRCLKVTYEVYLGGLNNFTNTYEGGTNFCVVPPLTNAFALAGIPATPEFVRQMKDACRAVVSSFVDHTKAPAGNFNAWFSTGDNTNATAFPMLNETNLVGVSTNFFDSTTNLLSAADFDQLHTVLTNLQWTAADCWAARLQTLRGTAEAESWTAAKSDAQANYVSADVAETNAVFRPSVWCGSEGVGTYEGTWTAGLNNYRIQNMVSNAWSGCLFVADVYLMVNWSDYWSSFLFYENDANTHFNVFHPQQAAGQSGSGSNGVFTATQWFGGTDPLSSQLPAWFAAHVPGQDQPCCRGYDATFKAVLKWDFKYK